MLGRVWTEMNEAASKAKPLTAEEMALLRQLCETAYSDLNACDQETRTRLQFKHDRFCEEFEPPKNTDEAILAKVQARKAAPKVSAQDRVHALAKRSWVVGLALVFTSFAFPAHALWILWLSMIALRFQVAGSILFEGGFTYQRMLSAVACEAAYPIYRWLLTPTVPFGHGVVFGTLACSVVLWIALSLVVLDAYRPGVAKKEKKSKVKTPISGNKKRKRS